MEERQKTTQSDDLEIFLEWTVPSRMVHERGFRWYLVATVLALALLVYSVFTANFLFGVMIILIALIVIINDAKPVKDLVVAVSNKGLVVGNQIYRYTIFESFYILYEPPRLQKLVLERGGIRGELTFDIVNQDPVAVRELLLQVIPENLEREDEPLADLFQKWFKL